MNIYRITFNHRHSAYTHQAYTTAKTTADAYRNAIDFLTKHKLDDVFDYSNLEQVLQLQEM